MITGIPQLNLDRSMDQGYQSANRTRQGYARERILKPAGHFFLPPVADMGFPSDWQQQPLWQEVHP